MTTNPIDQLLSSIKAERTPVNSQSPGPEKSPPPPGPVMPANTPDPLAAPQSVDDLLNQLGGKPSPPSTPTPPAPIGAGDKAPGSLASLMSSPAPVSNRESSQTPSLGEMPAVLGEFKADFVAQQQALEAQRRAEAERLERARQVALEQQQQAEAQRQRQQQEQRTKKAQAWLQQLTPLSGEALWFEEFVKHYPSRLEAAIAYLGDDPALD